MARRPAAPGVCRVGLSRITRHGPCQAEAVQKGGDDIPAYDSPELASLDAQQDDWASSTNIQCRSVHP